MVNHLLHIACGTTEAFPTFLVEETVGLGINSTRDRITGGNEMQRFPSDGAIIPGNLEVPTRSFVVHIMRSQWSMMGKDRFKCPSTVRRFFNFGNLILNDVTKLIVLQHIFNCTVEVVRGTLNQETNTFEGGFIILHKAANNFGTLRYASDRMRTEEEFTDQVLRREATLLRILIGMKQHRRLRVVCLKSKGLGVSTTVAGVRIIGRTDIRAGQDQIGKTRHHTIGEFITNMVSRTSPTAKMFFAVAIQEVDGLPPCILQVLGDIRDITSLQFFSSTILHRLLGHVVAETSKELDTQWPITKVGVGKIKHMGKHLLQLLYFTFSRVLILIVRLRLTITNSIITENLTNFSTGFNTGRISTEAFRGTMLTDVLLESLRKLPRTGAADDFTMMRTFAIEMLESHCSPVAMKTIGKARDRHGHVIRGQRFTGTRNIGTRKAALEVTFHPLTPLMGTIMLSSSIKSGLDAGRR